MKDKHRLGELTWQEAEIMMKAARAIIVPLGSTEQHGFHLPLNTDSTIADYLALEVAKRTNCLVTPTLTYGQVWSAKDFPGTIAIQERTYINFLKDIVTSLESKSPRNIILFSGHLGNVAPSKIAARELLDEKGFNNVYHFSYIVDMKQAASGIMETELWHGSGLHGGEMETSVLLRITPELVRMDKAQADYPVRPPDLDIRPISWIEFAKQGIFGDPTKATAEKGARFIERTLQQLADLVIENIH
ncbi:MAG: creatininase family protein [Anaerolineaceae bacterium]|nr:creatininase family protein [Anaerolineaceae bacterium]